MRFTPPNIWKFSDETSYVTVRNIGDGKFPNLYWVSYTNDYFILQDNYFDWASEYSNFKVTGKTIGPFKTFKKAKERATELAEVYLVERSPNPQEQSNDVNFISIEDRLSGEVYSIGIYVTPLRSKVEEEYSLDFTKKKMREHGYKFE